MGVTTQESVQFENINTDEPRNLNPVSQWNGKLQAQYFVHDQSGAGDATSSVAIVKLPAGRVRVFLGLSRAYINWTTGSATLDLGWDAYDGLDGVEVAADPDGLINGLDVDAVGMFGFDTYAALPAGVRATGGTYEFVSKEGVTLRLTSQDTAIASGDDAAGYIVFMVD
jgi:hypothetical protein